MNKAVFLDRDGTIIRFSPKVLSPVQIVPFKSAGRAIKLLNDLGYKVIVITNQPPIEKGEISLSAAKKLNVLLDKKLAKTGGKISAYYICPHKYGTDCSCRKPSPYLVNMAAKKFKIDLKQSFFIGDSTRDTQTGINAKIRTILVKTGRGGKGDDRKFFNVEADYTVKDLYYAARLIQKLDSAEIHKNK